MCSPTGFVSDGFSDDPYYAEAIRYVLDRANENNVKYKLPNCIFKILLKQNDFEMEQKLEYLKVVERIRAENLNNYRDAKQGKLRFLRNETDEFKKDKEFKRTFEAQAIQSIKEVLGETGMKRVMDLPPSNPRMIWG